jgi:hypothetical protein
MRAGSGPNCHEAVYPKGRAVLEGVAEDGKQIALPVIVHDLVLE